MGVAADADGEAIGHGQVANGSPMIAGAAIVASSCNTAEHHLAARPDAEAELDIDVFAMKDDLAADGDAALVRAQVIASVGEAKGVAGLLQRLAAIAMEELLGLLVIADALQIGRASCRERVCQYV